MTSPIQKNSVAHESQIKNNYPSDLDKKIKEIANKRSYRFFGHISKKDKNQLENDYYKSIINEIKKNTPLEKEDLDKIYNTYAFNIKNLESQEDFLNKLVPKCHKSIEEINARLTKTNELIEVIQKHVDNLKPSDFPSLKTIWQAQQICASILESQTTIHFLLQEKLTLLLSTLEKATNNLYPTEKELLQLANTLQDSIKQAINTLAGDELNETLLSQAIQVYRETQNHLERRGILPVIKTCLKNDLNKLKDSICHSLTEKINQEMQILKQDNVDYDTIAFSEEKYLKIKKINNKDIQLNIKNDLEKFEEEINNSKIRIEFNKFNANYAKATLYDPDFQTDYKQKSDYQFDLTMNGKTLNLQGKFDATTNEITAAGSFGRVFFGVDPDTGKKIAVKVVEKKLDKSWENLAREASILLQIQGKDHVVGASEIGIQDDFMFIVMDEIEGKELFHSIEALTPQEKTSIFLDIAKGLKAVHDTGIIHLDLKPENVMIDEKKKARVVDFGLSQFIWENSTKRVGTDYYMAPEIILRQEQTSAIDIYSFGLLMYKTITSLCHPVIKNYPFRNCVPNAPRLKNITVDQYNYNQLNNPKLQAHLANLTSRCLKANPAERIPIEELINELAKINILF